MTGINRKTGVTLIELSIGILISALLLVGIMNLLSAGMKGSTKGMSHQANMETASILMSQIEYDLLRATEIQDPPPNTKDSSARWKFYYAGSAAGPATVTYSKTTNGITRHLNLGGGKTENMTFASGHNVELNFTSFAVETGFEQVKHGMFVELTVASKEAKTAKVESFSMKRLIMIRSHF